MPRRWAVHRGRRQAATELTINGWLQPDWLGKMPSSCQLLASCVCAVSGARQLHGRLDGAFSLPPANLKLSLRRCFRFPNMAQWAERDSCVAEYMDLARADTPGMLNEAREWLLMQLDLYRWAACGTPCLL